MSQFLHDPLLSMREMNKADLPAVLQNEQAAYTHPWSMGIFRDCLKTSHYCCQTLSLGDRLVGHAVLSTGVREAHLLNLCIAPDWQGRHLGRRLLQRMLRLAQLREVDTVFLEVRTSNKAAVGLYESEGFCEVGQRRGYYPHGQNNREDALVFAKPIV